MCLYVFLRMYVRMYVCTYINLHVCVLRYTKHYTFDTQGNTHRTTVHYVPYYDRLFPRKGAVSQGTVSTCVLFTECRLCVLFGCMCERACVYTCTYMFSPRIYVCMYVCRYIYPRVYLYLLR